MSIANFIPQLWSARLLANLDKALVIARGANTNWEGEIRNVGDTVRIQRPNNLTVNAYPASGPITYEAPTSTTRSLVINQDRYWGFSVDDLDAVQANIDLVDRFTRRAAYSMANDFDTYLGSLYTAQAAGDVPLDLTASEVNVYGAFVAASVNLDLKNVPRMGRWAIVSPVLHGALVEDPKFVKASDLGDRTVIEGAVGRVSGFDVLISNNLTVATTRKCLYGTSDSITYARQLLGEPEALRSQDRIEDLVRGRMAYGALVVEPDALGTISVTEPS